MPEILNIINEIWKPIINYEGLYEISNYGRIKRFIDNHGVYKEKILKSQISGKYLQICLYKTKIKKYFLVHRLVLEAFVGPCPEGMESCHNDGNSTNNFLGNLRWDTHNNNCKDRKRHGTENNSFPILRGSKHPLSKLKEEDIPKIRKLIKEGLSDTEIGKIFNVHRSTIYRIRLEKIWKHVK